MSTHSLDDRPDPQALLAAVDRERQGTLKVFLGASPGVGKTFKMLEAAQEGARQGADVVIGVIETHGRRETEDLCGGLERVPLHTLDHRGKRFQEMDLDALIKRAPAIALVDELAHRNIPGSRHSRRYQDIEELLTHGIDVWTTLNIQHLESLNDTVARITGVRMRETVPDDLLSRASDVVLVDLTPRELIERLKLGKVYVPEQARAAMEGYFSPSNLAALRELALQTVANRIDADVREAMLREGIEGPWPVRSRVLVAVDGLGNSDEVVRLGRRLAERRRAPWTAAFVETGSSDQAQRVRVEKAFQLAERLGGQTVVLRGHDPVAELLEYARHQNVTSIVIGRTRHRPLAGLLRRTLSQRLLRLGSEFEITFVASPEARPFSRPRRPRLGRANDYLIALATVAVSVLLSAALEPVLALANMSLVFLVGVLLVAARTATAPAVVTALLSAAAYNFFFTEPRYSFYMNRTDDLLTVVFFLIVGLVAGQLAVRLRQQLQALRDTNEQTRTLAELNRRLAGAPDLASTAAAAAVILGQRFRAPVVVLSAEEAAGGVLQRVATSDQEVQLDAKAWSAAQWAYDHRQPSGRFTDTLASVEWRLIPLMVENEAYGVVATRFAGAESPPTESLATLDVLVSQVALAMARTRLAGNLEQARLAEETERLRSALLSSVSHDLRTPLASMIGSASTLRDLHADLSAGDRAELLDAIVSEGERLNRYIQNLLDMTRLGHGTLKIERDWIGLDDIVNAALRRTRDALRGVRIVRAMDADLPLLYVHPALIEQALVNVIENAARFSPEGGEIRIAAALESDEVHIVITDQGPGIPADERRRVFDMFFTGGNGDRGRQGGGLGLAICAGMVGAHMGRIEALPGPGGVGTSIHIHLPVTPAPEASKESV